MLYPLILLCVIVIGLVYAAWHAYKIDEAAASTIFIVLLFLIIVLAIAGIVGIQ